MRVLAAVLGLLIVLIQYPLWLGKGGWLRVGDLDRQVSNQKGQNEKLQQRNAGMDAEVSDLKQGFDAVEERARYELGMVRQEEVFFQIIRQPGDSKPAAGQSAPLKEPPAAKAATSASPAATSAAQ